MNKPVSKVREAKLELYRKKGKIHAREVRGRFNTIRWAMVWFTQLVFYGACWLQWGGRQAVLFDIPHEKFYLFGLVLWPQDALLLAIMLILAATGLFLVTALAGRLFCGFACPQTVYTEIFMWIEAKVEGDHLARLKLDQAPPSFGKLARRGTKYALWALVAAWTAISFVGYFTPIRELLPAVAGWNVGPWEGFWLIFYGLFTYVQAGFAREAVCQHMCPYSRFQGVMFDSTTRTVSYDVARGEPRKGAAALKAAGQGAAQGASQGKGDCIDCGICVQVCPTGIDIRDGLQYQCINCGLCVDACDDVMTKVAKPVGLIRFASEQELAGQPTRSGRPRLAVYGGLIGVFVALGAWTLSERSLLLVDVLRDRGSLSRETADGLIENAYTLKLMNLAEEDRDFDVAVSGLPGIQLVGTSHFSGEAGGIREVHVTVAAPPDAAKSGASPIAFLIKARQDPDTQVSEKSTFVLP
ncbi:MAG: cytochrome c oxidase accessory protein CcoG [Proteobacteria bacterium]|nr:cytochrome c oxidase accessory protein CcoG [Pseudomonadota bacterium]